ncbi:MAG: hypothetical protein AB1744_08895, partial [Candidatus Zixiibacteriota bacterium]
MTNKLRFRYIGIGLVAVFLLGIVYLLFSTLRVAAGISAEIDVPDYLVRLQIVNGSGSKGLEKEAAGMLSEFADPRLEIEIVGMEELAWQDLPQTFVVSRVKDKTAAKLLARRLGLDPSDVIHEPLEH